MTVALLLSGALLAIGLPALTIRRRFLITTVDGTSMEPTLRSGDRLLVRRTKRIRAGQILVFVFPALPKVTELVGARDGRFLIKRAVAVSGDRMPAAWGFPDLQEIAGTTVPVGSLAVLGDNRLTSWDSRHYGFVPRDRFVGVVVRRLPSSES